MAGSIPDNIILDSGQYVRLFKERIAHLRLAPVEISELIGFMVTSAAYKDEVIVHERKSEFVVDLIKSYEGCFMHHDVKTLEFALIELGQQIHNHCLMLGAYAYDGCSLPYHFHSVLADGSIILQFDYSDENNLW